MLIKYDRTCQRSLKSNISIEKTFAFHKFFQKKHFCLGFFLKESSRLALFNHLKIENFEKLWFFTQLDDTLKMAATVKGQKNLPYRCGNPASPFQIDRSQGFSLLVPKRAEKQQDSLCKWYIHLNLWGQYSTTVLLKRSSWESTCKIELAEYQGCVFFTKIQIRIFNRKRIFRYFN